MTVSTPDAAEACGVDRYVGTPAMVMLLPFGVPLCATEVKQWSVNGPASVDDMTLITKERSRKLNKSWGFFSSSVRPTRFSVTLHTFSALGVPCKGRYYVLMWVFLLSRSSFPKFPDYVAIFILPRTSSLMSRLR
jgi:hypothetical protein